MESLWTECFACLYRIPGVGRCLWSHSSRVGVKNPFSAIHMHCRGAQQIHNFDRVKMFATFSRLVSPLFVSVRQFDHHSTVPIFLSPTRACMALI